MPGRSGMCGATPVATTYAGAVRGSPSTSSALSSTKRAWPYRLGKPCASATSAYLACRRRSTNSCFCAISAGKLLDRHADELDARIAELEATRAEVRRLCERAATLDPAACVDADVCNVLT